MAATKRRTNSSKRRKTSTAKRRNFTLFSSRKSSSTTSRRGRRRVANPRRRGGRRRNPISTGTVAEGFKLAGSGVLIGFAQPWVRGLVGRFLPTGPIASAGVTLGTAYGLSWLSKMTGYTRTLERPLQLAGWTIVGAQVISTYVLPWVNSVFSGLSLGSGSTTTNGATTSGLGRAQRATMRDIVTLPAGKYDPYYGHTPSLAPASTAVVPAPAGSQSATLKDLLTMPAMPGVNRW